MSQGISRLAVTCWVLTHLCVRVRLAEFIRPKQTKMWLFEGRALHYLSM